MLFTSSLPIGAWYFSVAAQSKMRKSSSPMIPLIARVAKMLLQSRKCNSASYSDWVIATRIIKTISKGVVLIISPFLKKLYCRSSYLLYNQNKHCGFVSIALQLRLFGGDSNRSGLPELVISWVTLDVSFA